MSDVVTPEICDDGLLELIRSTFFTRGIAVQDVLKKYTKDIVVDCDGKINTLLVKFRKEDSTEIDVYLYILQAVKEIPKDNGISKSRFAHEGDFVVVLSLRAVTVLSELGQNVPALSFLTDKRATKGGTSIKPILCRRSLSEITNGNNFRSVGHIILKVTTVAKGKTHAVEEKKGGREILVRAILLNAKRPNQKCDYELLWVEYDKCSENAVEYDKCSENAAEYDKCSENAAANSIKNYDQEYITQSINVEPDFIGSQVNAGEDKSPDYISDGNDGDEGESVYHYVDGGMNGMMEGFCPLGEEEEGKSGDGDNDDDDDKECGSSDMIENTMDSMDPSIVTNVFEKMEEDPECPFTSSPSSPLCSPVTPFFDQGQYEQKRLMLLGLSQEDIKKNLVIINNLVRYDDGENFIRFGNVCGIEPPKKKACLFKKILLNNIK